MRIAIVAEVYLPKVDGVVGRTLNLVGRLQAAGDEVLIIGPDGGDCESPVPTRLLPSFACPCYPEYRIGIADSRVVGAVRDFAPDVVHYINPLAFGFQCFDALHRGGLRPPAVFSFHTLYGEFVKRYPLLRPLSSVLWWLARSYHNAADANLTVSPIMLAELQRRGFERVALWPPAVDSTKYHPHHADPAMRRRLADSSEDGPLLITVSRLAPEKNVSFLAGVLRRVPEARLAVIGDGPQRAELERQFAGTRTKFVGYLHGQELAAAYASADAFVYASETETMGNVVLEAMASGLCVVAPRAGGIPSLATDGRSALLYSPGDLQDAVHCVQKLLREPEYRVRIAAAARQSAEACTWDAAARRVRELYAETVTLAGQAERPPRPRLAPAVVAALLNPLRGLASLVNADRAPSGSPVPAVEVANA